MTAKTNKRQDRFGLWLTIGVVVGLALIAVVVIGEGGDDPNSEVDGPVVLEKTLDLGTAVAIGDQIAEIESIGFDEQAVSISPDDGRAKFVIFVAHWCPHCQSEVPRLVEWLRDGKKPDDLDVYMVSTFVDGTNQNFPPQAWLADEGVFDEDITVLLDTSKSEIADNFGLNTVPSLALVTADGALIQRESTLLSGKVLDELAARIT